MRKHLWTSGRASSNSAKKEDATQPILLREAVSHQSLAKNHPSTSSSRRSSNSENPYFPCLARVYNCAVHSERGPKPLLPIAGKVITLPGAEEENLAIFLGSEHQLYIECVNSRLTDGLELRYQLKLRETSRRVVTNGCSVGRELSDNGYVYPYDSVVKPCKAPVGVGEELLTLDQLHQLASSGSCGSGLELPVRCQAYVKQTPCQKTMSNGHAHPALSYGGPCINPLSYRKIGEFSLMRFYKSRLVKVLQLSSKTLVFVPEEVPLHFEVEKLNSEELRTSIEGVDSWIVARKLLESLTCYAESLMSMSSHHLREEGDDTLHHASTLTQTLKKRQSRSEASSSKVPLGRSASVPLALNVDAVFEDSSSTHCLPKPSAHRIHQRASSDGDCADNPPALPPRTYLGDRGTREGFVPENITATEIRDRHGRSRDQEQSVSLLAAVIPAAKCTACKPNGPNTVPPAEIIFQLENIKKIAKTLQSKLLAVAGNGMSDVGGESD